MTTAQVVEMSVTVNNHSPIQDYVHLDDHTQPTYEMTPGFKPEGEETRPGTKRQCFHNLQSGHPAWWSVDNIIAVFFPQ